MTRLLVDTDQAYSMVSKSSVLVLTGSGISTNSGSGQPPKSDCSGGLDDRRRSVAAVTGTTPSSNLPPRRSKGCVTAAQSPCSIPSGRGSYTPTLTCNGFGCLEADYTEQEDSRPPTGNRRRKQPSQRLFTPLRSDPVVINYGRLHPQQP